MSLRFPEVLLALLLMTGLAEARGIRVCADPDNMPFSNARLEGFENRILAEVADEMDARIVYVWGNERRATAIEVMEKGRCDLVPGTIANAPGVATTRPYMRSAYAFVTRGAAVEGFDDPRLRSFRIGVQSVGDDAVTPPVEALLHRGLDGNIQPFTLHGSAADPNTAGGIVHAVAAHDIDAAVLWGPFAGYFAARQDPSLAVALVDRSPADPPMQFDIAMATRRDDVELRDAVDHALAARREKIEHILAAYHVPVLPLGGGEAAP